MPTSDHHNITPILSIVNNLQPKTVLDIGCGMGKYGMLLREYLDVSHGRLQPEEWQVRIDGIDAFNGYRNPVWHYAYNSVKIGLANEQLLSDDRYDLIMICDVIEHLEIEQAKQLVTRCLDQAKWLLISTPKSFYAQQQSFGNDHERHLCLWRKKDFPTPVYTRTISALACNIYLASRQPLSWKLTYPADFADLVYLRSRARFQGIGRAALPISKTIQYLIRLLS